MIITNNSMYLHIPKTAGKWISSILSTIKISDDLHQVPFDQPCQPNIFVFVRNPWDWHVSFYEFHRSGSEITYPSVLKLAPIVQILPENCSFDYFINIVNDPPLSYKKKLFNLSRRNYITSTAEIDKLFWNTQMKTFSYWLENDCGLYQHYYNLYTKYSTKIGKFENIRIDLRNMLEDSKELTDEIEKNIFQSISINVTTNKKNWKDYYSNKLTDIVLSQSFQIIKNHNYEF